MSALFPRLATCVDDMAFVHSMQSKSALHGPAMFMMNSGFILPGFPSMGAWVTYGLGSEAANAVLQHAFSALRADLLLARHHPDNVACKATLKKTGFHYVGNGVYGEESQADFPTYIMTEAEFSEKVEAERALPALQSLVEHYS